MSSSGRLFAPLADKEISFLKKLSSKIANDKLSEARISIVNRLDTTLLHLLHPDKPDDELNEAISNIIDFCRQDEELQNEWKIKLQNKNTKETPETKELTNITVCDKTLTERGAIISAFDHYLGCLAYIVFIRPNFDRQDRKQALDLACSYGSYHALLAKCKSLINTAVANQSPIDLNLFYSLTQSLGENYWALGHLQAFCLLDKLLPLYPDNKPLAEEPQGLDAKDIHLIMMREFQQAKLLAEDAQSLALFTAIHPKMKLDEFLHEVFGVRSIDEAEALYKAKHPQIDFSTQIGPANQELSERLEQRLEAEEERAEEEEESKQDLDELNHIKLALRKAQADSVEIDHLVKLFLLKKSPKPSVTSQESDSKNTSTINKTKS